MNQQGAASVEVEYHKRREKKRDAYKYRLVRRTDEVLKAISAYKSDASSLSLSLSLSWTSEPQMVLCLIGFVRT